MFPNQYFEADFLWNVNLKILNSVIILKKFTDDSLHMKLSLALDSLDGWRVKMLTSFGILPGSESWSIYVRAWKISCDFTLCLLEIPKQVLGK